jgi:hypothetical protein
MLRLVQMGVADDNERLSRLSGHGGFRRAPVTSSARARVSGFPLFCRQNAAALDVADACVLPHRGADEALLRRQAVHAGPGRRVIVFAAGRCGVDGQSGILPSGQDDRSSRGKSADDGEWYNPTLSCANRGFMLFRNGPGPNPVLPEAQRGGNRQGKNFFIWIRCNPLKSPESAKEIQGNASFFAWFYLDLLGFIWTARRTRVSAPLP